MNNTNPTAAVPDAAIGRRVSMDVSTGDHDAGHRIFGVVIDTLDDDDRTLIAEETSRNFSPTPHQQQGESHD